MAIRVADTHHLTAKQRRVVSTMMDKALTTAKCGRTTYQIETVDGAYRARLVMNERNDHGHMVHHVYLVPFSVV